MKYFSTIIVTFSLTLGAVFMLATTFVYAKTDVVMGTRVDTGTAGGVTKVAPGETLPISVKLSNFGAGSRVDVLVTYTLLTKAGVEISSKSDTVAVETTASFLKTIDIPFATSPGTYIARTSVIYGGQLVPATTQFSFVVEPKILGLFRSNFYFYGAITIVISLSMLLLSNILMRRRRRGRLTPFDYSEVPHSVRTFYEILSDTITAMRLRVGDDALLIASSIEGLRIDGTTGRVLDLTGPPGKIIAHLVSEYEAMLGKKVSFSLRKEETEL